MQAGIYAQKRFIAALCAIKILETAEIARG